LNQHRSFRSCAARTHTSLRCFGALTLGVEHQDEDGQGGLHQCILKDEESARVQKVGHGVVAEISAWKGVRKWRLPPKMVICSGGASHVLDAQRQKVVEYLVAKGCDKMHMSKVGVIVQAQRLKISYRSSHTCRAARRRRAHDQ